MWPSDQPPSICSSFSSATGVNCILLLSRILNLLDETGAPSATRAGDAARYPRLDGNARLDDGKNSFEPDRNVRAPIPSSRARLRACGVTLPRRLEDAPAGLIRALSKFL